MWNRIRSIAQNIALLGVTVAVALGLAEGGLRLTGKVFPASLFSADPVLGWSLRPNAEGWVIGEARTHVKINSDGMRDVEHETAKPAGAVRIAFLGDSYTEAFNVEPSEAFWAKAGAAAECLGRPTEVLNFGVSGYGTAQAYLMLAAKVWKYKPDVVVLAFYPGNDVFNNHRKLNPSSAEQSPYFELRDGELVEDRSFQKLAQVQPGAIRNQNRRSALINRVRLLQMLFQVRNDLRTRSQQKAPGKPADIEQEMHGAPQRPELEQAWAVTEALMARMNREAAEHGAQFHVAVISTRPQVDPDAGRRAEYARRPGVENLNYSEDRVVAMGLREGVPVIALGRWLAEYTLEHKEYINGGGLVGAGEGHWNALGHRLAGERIGAALCSGGKQP